MAILDFLHDLRVSLYLANPAVGGITARSEPSAAVNATPSNTTSTCPEIPLSIPSHQILLPRTPFITILTLLSLTTVLSLLALSLLLYRQFSRARQLERAKQWGRQSEFYESRGKRISLMRKEIDDSFSRQYSGVLTTVVVENPEMGSDSPVEICERDSPRIWEVGSGTVRYGRVKEERRVVEEKEGKVGARGSLFFCRDLGVWMSKR